MRGFCDHFRAEASAISLFIELGAVTYLLLFNSAVMMHLGFSTIRQFVCKHGEIVEANVVETGGTTEDHVIMIGGHRPFSWVGPARPHWHHAGAAMASRRLCWPSRGHVCAILCDLGAIKMSFSSARIAYF